MKRATRQPLTATLTALCYLFIYFRLFAINAGLCVNAYIITSDDEMLFFFFYRDSFIFASDSSATKADIIIVHTIKKRRTNDKTVWKMNIEHRKREEYFVICYRFRLPVSSAVCHRSSLFSAVLLLFLQDFFYACLMPLFDCLVLILEWKNPCPICSSNQLVTSK